MADRAQTCSTARVRCPAQGGAAGGMIESADTDGSVWQEAAREDNPSLARTLTWRTTRRAAASVCRAPCRLGACFPTPLPLEAGECRRRRQEGSGTPEHGAIAGEAALACEPQGRSDNGCI